MYAKFWKPFWNEKNNYSKKKTILKAIYIYTWSALSAVLSTKQIKLPSSLCNVEEKTKGVCLYFFWIIVLELESWKFVHSENDERGKNEMELIAIPWRHFIITTYKIVSSYSAYSGHTIKLFGCSVAKANAIVLVVSINFRQVDK